MPNLIKIYVYFVLTLNFIIDDIVEISEKKKLSDYLEKWLSKKIRFVLKSLIELNDLKQKITLKGAKAFDEWA